MFQSEKFESKREADRGGAGGTGPDLEGAEDLDPSDLPPIPDNEDLDLDWGTAVMPDFSDDPATSLPVASADNKDIYAAAKAVDSTDATVISDEARTDDKGNTNWIPLVVIVAVLAVAAAGWFLVANTNLFSGPAARVNGETISIRDLDARIASIEAQNPAMFNPEMGGAERGHARLLVLDAMIDDVLLLQEASNLGVNVSNADVQEEIDAMIATYPSEADFEEDLAANNFSREMLEERILVILSVEALLEVAVPEDSISEEEIRTYYDENIGLFIEAAAKRTSHILIPLDDRARGIDLLTELQDSTNLEEDFARIAEESSADAGSAAAGGDAGWPGQPEQRLPAYIEAVDELAVGELSELVRTEIGYYIILVTDEREESVHEFEEVAPAIRGHLIEAARNNVHASLLDRLRDEADIDIYDPEVLEFQEGAADPDGDEPNVVEPEANGAPDYEEE